MRMSCSRHVVGVETVWAYAGKPPSVVLGIGIRASSAWPAAVIGTAAGFATFGQSGPGHKSEKLPPRSATDGTFWSTTEGFFSRRHSWEEKKKVFFLSEL